MPAYDPANTNPATLLQRERRKRLRQAKLEAGWVDGRYRAPSAAPRQPYLAVQRWRFTHRDQARMLDRVYKGMKRNLIFQAAWPRILAHYGGGCIKCGTTERVAPDHVLPVLGDPVARNVLRNLQPLCRHCNGMKRGRSDDYRPDGGAWIETLPSYNVTLHPTGKRARWGSNQWMYVRPVSKDTSCVSHTICQSP